MNEAESCPECGYTDADARRQMDHYLCKSYPFFTKPGGYEARCIRADVPTEQLPSTENRSLDFVRSFIRGWEAFWVYPDDPDHEMAELYSEAKEIVKAVPVVGRNQTDPIDDSLLFSQRCLAEKMVNDWMGQNRVDSNVFNVVTALDALGLLNRGKVREEFSKAIKPARQDNGRT